MSLLSLSTAAGPSSTTLEALSEYCASSDSPDASFPQSDSSYSFISELDPASLSSKAIPELPDIIAQSVRFQSASVHEKMLQALRFSTGSGFTRPEPPSSGYGSRRNRGVSIQAIYEGLPPSPSDCFFNDASVMDNSTPIHVGLGIFIPSSGTSDLRLLSPLASRSTSSPTPDGDAPADGLLSRLLLSSPSPVSRNQLTMPSRPASPTSNEQVSSSRYAGVGLGLPSQRTTSSAGTASTVGTSRFGSSFTLSSLSLVLRLVPSSSSYTPAFFNGLPELTRCSRLEPDVSRPKLGPFARLKSGAANFMRERLRRVSAVQVASTGGRLFGAEFAARTLRMTRDEGQRTLGAVVRFLARK
ncbi:hypothetical protein K438DRAFT_1976887 [Mycena galopus ATCC 62051]|nr:hypothetical protein K438DRAFT_1976887 [Mycena galopus ATCC 62051]